MMTERAANIFIPLVIKNGIFYLLLLLMAFGLKYHYSRACSQDLIWILNPTAYLVEQISGIQFENETHTGFVSREYRIIIAPSCAGVNFFIMSFCMAAFCGMHVIEHPGLKLLWVAVSLVCAYILTVAVNALRIIISIYSYNSDSYYGWLTPARIHRLEGIVIYFFFLYLFYMIIIKIVHRIRKGVEGKQTTAAGCGQGKTDHFGWACTGLIPLFWYGLMTLGIPLFTGAFQENLSRFKEHSWTVVCASMTVVALIFLIQLLRRPIMRIMIKIYFATKTKITFIE